MWHHFPQLPGALIDDVPNFVKLRVDVIFRRVLFRVMLIGDVESSVGMQN